MTETETLPTEPVQPPAPVDETLARAEKAEAQLKETTDRMLRVAADFENFKRRSAKEREETVKLANERLLRDLLPIVDNLERALATPGESDALREGVKLVHKQFVDTLSRFGATPFSSVGTPFDPMRHEALMQQESAEVPAGHVVTEIAKGYMMGERLIRPASVVVARAPEATA